MTRYLLLSFALVACGSSSSGSTTPPEPTFTPSTVPVAEVDSCGTGCDRVGQCWQAGWGTTMPDEDRATCESNCLTMTPDDGDAWMTELGAETDCAAIVKM